MSPGSYAVIILAAGFSSRMQRFKPLLPLGDESVVDHLISVFQQNGVEVFLITGYQQDILLSGIKCQNIQVVPNPDYAKGMFSSIQAGMRAVGERYQAVFIAPVDIPLISPATIRRLLLVTREHPGKVIRPTFNGKRGHPPLIPGFIAQKIADAPEDTNLKAVLNTLSDITFEIPVPDSNILFDIDCPADYEELLKRYQNRRVSE